MKKLLLATSFSVLSIISFAQEKPVINVIGSSQISVDPQKTIISYSINSTKDSYAESISDMTNRIDALTNSLVKFGFDKKEIKTANFNIRKDRKYRHGEPQGDEYVATQSLEVKFDHSTKRLLEVLNKTASGDSAPSISISFGLSKKQALESKQKLMHMAMRDAKTKAELLIGETRYSIKGIKEISYGNSYSQPQPYSGKINMTMSMAKNDISNFETKQLVLRDQVSIVYFISK